jgi:UDP-N-acetylmuramyl pentapeptide phosphotransferase/UDP-N-acetylglucosamine-1-phosphate transferase
MGEATWPAAVGVATGLFACVTTRVLIPILTHREILDRPNERSSHQVATPRGGGIAVIGWVLLAWILLALTGSVPSGVFGIALGAVFLGAVSWLDDLRGLSPLVRLLAQAAAVAIGVFVLPGPQNAFHLAAIGLVWIWWINLFNFMDGIDGLAGSEAAAIGAGLLLFANVGAGAGADPALRALAAALTGAAIGFLVWNWSPSRIFLGDVGSVPLGYLLGFLLLGLAVRGHWRIALILPLYFLADATITLARRLLRGERIWQAHRKHFYQQAVRRGLGHAAVVKRVIAADLVLIGCGWAAENGWGAVSLAASASTVAILLTVLARALETWRDFPGSPISAVDDDISSPDPPRADFGQ